MLKAILDTNIFYHPKELRSISSNENCDAEFWASLLTIVEILCKIEDESSFQTQRNKLLLVDEICGENITEFPESLVRFYILSQGTERINLTNTHSSIVQLYILILQEHFICAYKGQLIKFIRDGKEPEGNDVIDIHLVYPIWQQNWIFVTNENKNLRKKLELGGLTAEKYCSLDQFVSLYCAS